jgi:hypothetical protein
MRAFGIVLAAERVDVSLLCRAGLPHRFDGLPFERPMHPLVRAVLLR